MSRGLDANPSNNVVRVVIEYDASTLVEATGDESPDTTVYEVDPELWAAYQAAENEAERLWNQIVKPESHTRPNPC